METRYGKVFVLRGDTTVSGKEIITSNLLASTFFSNIDFKWYDSEGNLSPLYEKYKGRSFGVQFNFNQKDKDGQHVDLTGKFNLPYKLGEIGHQDFESVATATKEMTQFWRIRGVLSEDVLNDDGYNTIRKGQTAAVVAAFCPGWKISNFKTFHTWMDPFYILDDHMDKATSRNDVTFKTSNLYWSTLNRVVEGKPFEESEDVKKLLLNIPKQYSRFMKGMQAVREVIVEKKGDPTYLIQAYKDFHNALSIESSSEWKQKQADPDSKFYAQAQKILRIYIIAIPLTFELILFDKGIKISENVRESFLFKSIIHACSKHVYLINDILSLKKEMGVETSHNLVCEWHHRDGLSLHEAYQNAVNKCNLLEQVVKQNGELIVKCFGEDGAEAVNICKDIVYGNVQWYGSTTRYHSDMKFDCIVEIE